MSFEILSQINQSSNDFLSKLKEIDDMTKELESNSEKLSLIHEKINHKISRFKNIKSTPNR